MEGIIERRHRDILLGTLHAEVQALRREVHERQELGVYLLRTIAADLAAHQADCEVHSCCRPDEAGRHSDRPARFSL